jgi:transposase
MRRLHSYVVDSGHETLPVAHYAMTRVRAADLRVRPGRALLLAVAVGQRCVVRRVQDHFAMPQNFIACDRGQTMLMPPDLTDWVPDDHVVWSILGAVDQMDLSAFYGAYRENGQGRAAYEPSMMVALLFYAYARGNRSSRGIERECREDVVYKLITAMRVPDHSTVAEFRRRHERALGELFCDVLALCDEAGLVEVGVISIDGTKIRANASRGANRTYEKLVADILKEAEETDRWEDGLFGSDRGDELPEHLRSEEGRRAAFAAAKERLAQKAGREEEPEVARIEPDPEQFTSTRGWGRRTWHREAHKELLRRREQAAGPIPASRPARLLEALHRLEENQQVEIQASEAYERWQAERRAGGVPGQRLGMPPKPYTSPSVPGGVMNKTDPDSRMMRTQGQPTIQGYNAQAAVTRGQIIVAAEIAVESPDFGHLEPTARAAFRELEAAGVTQRPETVLADAGYWHTRQIESIVSNGIQVLVPPDAGLREGTRPGWDKGPYAFMRRVLASEAGHELYKHRKATVEPVFAQNKFNRGFRRFQRRGRAAARSEWRFQAAIHNLLKLHTHSTAPAIA